MKMLVISPEMLADLMTQAYHDGWESHRIIGYPEDCDRQFVEYLEAAEALADESTRH